MKARLEFVFGMLVATIFPSMAQLLPATEKVAVRREMIEKDIAIRNLASIIALGAEKELMYQLSQLSEYQMLSHPQLREPFERVLAQWKKKGVEKYFTSLQKTAQNLKALLASQDKSKLWEKMAEGYQAILADCRFCHETLQVEVGEGN
ncbi:MAG: hypothetical protein NZM25_00250 [Leptospiraceae bacterium]|nr:hypothetical protein [Leptospiraceae bacterium]MDW8307528.1 hypothetical protein [Leptospiraceae bacterium]